MKNITLPKAEDNKAKCESCIHFQMCIYRQSLYDLLTTGPVNPYNIKTSEEEAEEVFKKVGDLVLGNCRFYDGGKQK